jgi:hypothetical protein
MKNVTLTLLLALSSVVALDVGTASAAAPANKSTIARLYYIAPTKRPTPGGNVSINPQPLPPRYLIKR